METTEKLERPRTRSALILLSLLSGCLVMAIGMHLDLFIPAVPVGFLYGVQAVVVAGFLVSAVVAYRSARLYGYWRLAFAFFVAALAVVLSNFTGDSARS